MTATPPNAITVRSVADVYIIGALLLGRIAFLLASPTGLSGDAYGYVAAAESIVSTGRLPALFVQPRGLSVLISPLYWLAGTHIPFAVLLLHVVMDTAVISVLLLSAWQIIPGAHRRAIRFCACAAILVQPFTAEFVSSVYTEQAVQFFLFFGTLALVGFAPSPRTTSLILIGPLLLGIAAILRIDVLMLAGTLLMLFLLAQMKAARLRAWSAISSLIVYLAVPALMLAFQFHSTEEIGLIKPGFHHSGYMSWMRTWFAVEKIEHDKYAFDVGSNSWAGFDPANYPARAFGDREEREQISRLLAVWQASEYSESVDVGFRDIARKRLHEAPLRRLVGLPAVRMLHYWINIDGAQTILRVVHIVPPLSTAIVGGIVLLRLVLLGLALTGVYAVWRLPAWREVVGRQVNFARLASVAVLLRTVEMGILGTFSWAGLMEVRYVQPTFPFVIMLALFGLRFSLALEYMPKRKRLSQGVIDQG